MLDVNEDGNIVRSALGESLVSLDVFEIDYFNDRFYGN